MADYLGEAAATLRKALEEVDKHAGASGSVADAATRAFTQRIHIAKEFVALAGAEAVTAGIAAGTVPPDLIRTMLRPDQS